VSIVELLREALDRKASDLHVTVDSPPVIRVNGELVRLDLPHLQPADTRRLLMEMLDEDQAGRFESEGEVDFAHSIAHLGRFRVNGYRQRGSAAIAIRLIGSEIKSLRALGLPETLANLARRPRGLVLVTGPTGSGKTTTLASMIDLINREFEYHIITLEDPIEYLHRHQRSVVNQREIGSDTQSFASGLRAALREDPDVVLVGEMRDLETIATALRAAETGHLVLATLHTNDASQTIDRVVDAFPPYQQEQVKVQLGNCLEGIVAQRLIPRMDSRGRVVAVEVLVANPAIRNLIREGKTHQIPSSLQTGSRYGMKTMDASLRELYAQQVISAEDYVFNASDPAAVAREIGYRRSDETVGER
jgi:twitching motility protein PilT